MNGTRYVIALILVLLLRPAVAGAGKIMEVWPQQIEVAVISADAQLAGVNWGAGQSTINLRIDTRQIGGQTWRLWLLPRSCPANVPVQVIRWQGRPPMVSGAAAPDQRVLAGQGPVDGRLVQTSLVFSAQGAVPKAGFFPVQFDFILERLP